MLEIMKLRGLLVVVSVVVLIIILGSCSKDRNDQSLILDIPKEFEFSMKEQLQPSDRPLILEIKTIDTVVCSGCKIDASVTRDGNIFHIVIANIEDDSTATITPTVPQVNLNLGSLTAGTYPLFISLKEVITLNGSISVTNNSYKLTITNPQSIRIKNEELLRLPSDAVFGYIGCNSNLPLHTPTVDSLLQLMDALNLNGATTPPGNYGYFTLGTNGIILSYKDTLTTEQYRPIFLRTHITENDIQSLLYNYQYDNITFPYRVLLKSAKGYIFYNN